MMKYDWLLGDDLMLCCQQRPYSWWEVNCIHSISFACCIMTWYPTQLHYPDTEPITPCSTLIKPSARLGSTKYHGLTLLGNELPISCTRGPRSTDSATARAELLVKWSGGLHSILLALLPLKLPDFNIRLPFCCDYPTLTQSQHETENAWNCKVTWSASSKWPVQNEPCGIQEYISHMRDCSTKSATTCDELLVKRVCGVRSIHTGLVAAGAPRPQYPVVILLWLSDPDAVSTWSWKRFDV